MTLAYPWSGRDWGGGVPLSRRVAVPGGLLLGRQRAIHRAMRGLGRDGEAADIQEGGTYVPPPPWPAVIRWCIHKLGKRHALSVVGQRPMIDPGLRQNVFNSKLPTDRDGFVLAGQVGVVESSSARYSF
jgi:hypothetical protein